MKTISIVSGRYAIIWVCVFALFTACDQNKNHQPLVPLPTLSETEDLTVSRKVQFQDIQPILAQNCVGCHDYATNQASFDQVVKSGEVGRRIWLERENPLVSMPQGPKSSTIQTQEREAIWHYALGVLRSPPKTEQAEAESTTPSTTPLPSSSLPIVETDQYKLVSSCTNCHGVEGVSQISGIPNLAGLTYEYILNQILSFQKVKIDENENFIVLDSSSDRPARQDTNSSFGFIMNKIVHDLNSEQSQFIASYFSISKREFKEDDLTLPPPPTFSMCISCHDGSRGSIGPLIHGQNAEYIANQLRAYKRGTRSDSTMNGIAAILELDDIDELAKYISQLQTQ